MRLSEHLGKGIWALADRGLPAIYALVGFLIARVLGLTEYGTYIIFQAVFNMLFSFTDNFALQAIVKYGVEPGIDLEELITATGSLFLGFLLPVLIVLNVAGHPVSILLGNVKLDSLFPLLAIYVLISAPRVIFVKVLQMRFRMREIFFVDLANYGIGGILLVIGLTSHQIDDAQAVIYRIIIASGISSIIAVLFARNHLRLKFCYSKSMFSRIGEFVRYQGATGVVSTLQQNIDQLAVSGFTGAEGAAIYGFAKSFYRIFDIMRDTVTLLVFPAVSKYHSRRDLQTVRTILEKSVGFLYLVLIPLSALLFVATPVIFHLISGEKFEGSILIFRILVVGSLALPIQMVFISSLVGMGEVKRMFRIISIGLTVNLTIAFILLPTIGIVGSAIAFVAGNCVQATLSYRFIRPQVGFEGRKIFIRAWSDARMFFRAKSN